MKENITKKSLSKYYYTVGKRKMAVAQVKLYDDRKALSDEKKDDVTDKEIKTNKKGEAFIIVNNQYFKNYFKGFDQEFMVLQPLRVTSTIDKFGFQVRVRGGGLNAQAGAVRHGIAKAIVLYDEAFKAQVKPIGLLKRDARTVERKKFGLRKARRSKQWSKR
jgi:small subunit ribosomal protein S9